MIHRTLINLTAATTLAFAGTAALAQSNGGQSGNGQTMTIPQVVKSLEDAGYTDIESVDRDLDRYEVEATSPDGQRVELAVDGTSGKVLNSEREDD